MKQLSLKKAIVSIPIKPKKEYDPGYLIIPFLTSYLAKKAGKLSVLACNMRVYEDDLHKLDVRSFRNALRNLTITTTATWIDTDTKNISEIEYIFKKLIQLGHVYKKTTSILCCPCQRIEMLPKSENWSDKHKLYKERNGKRFCVVCKGEVALLWNQEVYVFKIPKYSKTISVLPEFAATEISEIGKTFARKEILITRSRPSALKITLGKEIISLDPDFAWQLYLLVLRRTGIIPEYVITSQKNLLGTYLAAALYALFHTDSLTLVVPSYGVLQNQTHKEEIKRKIENPLYAKLFLLSHITFEKKQSLLGTKQLEQLDTKALSEIEKKVEQYVQESKLTSVENLLNAFTKKGFRKIIESHIFNSKKYKRIEKSLRDNEFFVQGCLKAFGANLVCIQQIGSGKRRETNPFSDIDYIVVIQSMKSIQLKQLREFVKSIDFLIDCSVLALDEMETGDRFRIGSHGAYQLALILPESTTLYGDNIFKKMKMPSVEAIRRGVKDKIGEYTWWARRMYVESNRERSLALNYQVNSRLIKMMRDVLYLKNGLGMKEHKTQLVTNFLTEFSKEFSSKEKILIHELAESENVTTSTTNMSEEYLDERLAIVNKLYKLSRPL